MAVDSKAFKTAVDNVHKELNTLIDGEFKARRLTGLRSLDRAAKTLGLVVTHVDKAVEQTTAKAAKAPKAKK